MFWAGNDIGSLAPGTSADFIAFDIDRPQFAGAHADIVSALVLCQNDFVDYSFINGRKVVDRGQLLTLEMGHLVERTNRISAAML